MNDQLNREERLALLSSLNSINKFAPKMDFTQRCEVLALRHAGVGREVLAKMYGVDRRTITHICNPLSPHYKKVRELEVSLGVDKFRDTYLTDDLLSTALAKSIPEIRNNPHAKGKAGLHTVQGKNCAYVHRVVVKWIESGTGIETPGWYYQDLDSDFPDGWFTAGGPESLKTSMACYNAMLGDITDKLS